MEIQTMVICSIIAYIISSYIAMFFIARYMSTEETISAENKDDVRCLFIASLLWPLILVAAITSWSTKKVIKLASVKEK